MKYEHKVRLHKVGSELFGKYNLGIVCGEHGVGHICVQEVSGRYARELVAGSPLIRVRLFAPEERDVHPASAAQANELIATHECVELVVGVSMQMLAKQLQDVARKLEPELTRELSKLAAERGGTLKGLDHRLKTVESLLRKIRRHRGEPRAAGRAGGRGTTDADRAALPTASTAAITPSRTRCGTPSSSTRWHRSVYKLKEKLKTLGYDAYQEKNYWGVGDTYQGINDVFISPVKLGTEGDAHFKFEVQMHTPESFALKMGLGHRLYEKFRVERDPEKKLQLWEESLTAADAVPVPEGALSIPHLTSYPQPDEVAVLELLLFRAVHRATRDQSDGRPLRRPPGVGVRRRRADGVGEERRARGACHRGGVGDAARDGAQPHAGRRARLQAEGAARVAQEAHAGDQPRAGRGEPALGGAGGRADGGRVAVHGAAAERGVHQGGQGQSRRAQEARALHAARRAQPMAQDARPLDEPRDLRLLPRDRQGRGGHLARGVAPRRRFCAAAAHVRLRGAVPRTRVTSSRKRRSTR